MAKIQALGLMSWIAAAAGRLSGRATSTPVSASTRLARAFAAKYGIPPHAYIDSRRLDAARDRILRGQSLADVALDVGYHDQANLTRRFKRWFGTTPGGFRPDEGTRARPGASCSGDRGVSPGSAAPDLLPGAVVYCFTFGQAATLEGSPRCRTRPDWQDRPATRVSG